MDDWMDALRTERFIASYREPLPSCLEEMEREARDGDVPILRPAARDMLKVICAMKNPEQILEIGAATGFSSIFMCVHSDAHVTTIENYPVRIPVAKANIEKYGFSERISLIEGDALSVLPGLSGRYDLIFLDAAQGQYITFLPELLRLLTPRGVLITDNVLKGGEIRESRYAVPRRNRTIHSRVREYLYAITHDDALRTAILPIGDGLALTVKERDETS